MTTLFIDSTYDLTIGLLDDQFKWLDLNHLSGKKASVILQPAIFELCEKHKIKFSEIKNIVTTAGPGFYTGLRLSEGFADVMTFFRIPHYSFYSYEIPKWCGVIEGTWLTKAYRGEYFFYHWNKNQQKVELVAVKDLTPEHFNLSAVFIHSDSALDESARVHLKKHILTFDLLKNESELIFKNVFENKLKRESYYFRAPEDEFRMNP